MANVAAKALFDPRLPAGEDPIHQYKGQRTTKLYTLLSEVPEQCVPEAGLAEREILHLPNDTSLLGLEHSLLIRRES
jgi:hypothetical protein